MKKKILILSLLISGAVFGEGVIGQKVKEGLEKSFNQLLKTSEVILENNNKVLNEEKKINEIKNGEIDKEIIAQPDIITKPINKKSYEYNFEKKSKTIIIKENNVEKQQEIIDYAQEKGFELREINNGNLVFKRKE